MDNWKIDYITTERYPSWASTHLKDQKAIVKSKTIKSEPSSVNLETDENKPALPEEEPAKKCLLTVSSDEDSSNELVDSPLFSKKAKLDHTGNLDTPGPISLTPLTEIATSDENPHDIDVISISTPPIVIPVVKNPLDMLNHKLSVRPLPRMISSTTTTTITPHINTSPSPPSPGPSNNTLLPAVPAAPSPITPAPTTNAKRMRRGPNKNGRMLCTHRWLNGVAKDGTTADFKIYWTALPKDAKKKYELGAAQLVASGVWHANTADTILNVSSGTVY